MFSVDTLSRIESIGGLKVLIAMYKKKNRDGILFPYSNKDIADDSGVSASSVIKATRELVGLGLVIIVGKEGRVPVYVYCADHEEDIGQAIETWNEDRERAIRNGKIRFDEIRDDIAVISDSDPNYEMTDSELRTLSNKILKEHFYDYCLKRRRDREWYAMQSNVVVEQLRKYRVDQVIAIIEYWTQVSPPADGIRDIRFIFYEGASRSNPRIALKYFWEEYNILHRKSIERARMLELAHNAKIAAELIKEKEAEEKEKIEAMSDSDFISSLMKGMTGGGVFDIPKERQRDREVIPDNF